MPYSFSALGVLPPLWSSAAMKPAWVRNLVFCCSKLLMTGLIGVGTGKAGILVFGEQRRTEMHGALQVRGGRALEVAADALRRQAQVAENAAAGPGRGTVGRRGGGEPRGQQRREAQYAEILGI